MPTCVASIPAVNSRPRSELMAALLPLAAGLVVAQAGVLSSHFFTLSNPGVAFSDGSTAEAPEQSCVGCHFETPGDDAAPGQAEAAHQRFVRAAGLAIRSRP